MGRLNDMSMFENVVKDLPGNPHHHRHELSVSRDENILNNDFYRAGDVFYIDILFDYMLENHPRKLESINYQWSYSFDEIIDGDVLMKSYPPNNFHFLMNNFGIPEDDISDVNGQILSFARAQIDDPLNAGRRIIPMAVHLVVYVALDEAQDVEAAVDERLRKLGNAYTVFKSNHRRRIPKEDRA